MSQGRVKPGWYGDMVAPAEGSWRRYAHQLGSADRSAQRQHQQRSGVGRALAAILCMPWPTVTIVASATLHRQCLHRHAEPAARWLVAASREPSRLVERRWEGPKGSLTAAFFILARWLGWARSAWRTRRPSR